MAMGVQGRETIEESDERTSKFQILPSFVCRFPNPQTVKRCSMFLLILLSQVAEAKVNKIKGKGFDRKSQ